MPLTPRVVRGFKIAYSVSFENEYKMQLLRLVRELEYQTTKLLLESSSFQSSYNTTLNNVVRRDDVIDDLGGVMRSINAAIGFELTRSMKSLSKRFSTLRKFTERSFNKSLSHITSQLSEVELSLSPVSLGMRAIPALPPINVLKKMWIEKNVKLIKSIPADALSRVSDVVHESIKAGESMQSLSTKLVHVFKISQTNAKRIARDQMAKLKGDLNRHNDLTHGFTSYEWSSCKDSAVRVSHEVMEGKICSWTDPTIYKNKITDNWKKRSSIGGVLKHIGADYQCRCTNIVLQERLVHEH